MMITATNLQKKLLSCDDYHRMIASGIINSDEKIELLNGELLIMSPVGPNHGSIVNRLNHILNRHIGSLGIVSVQNPITIAPHSEPEPDIAILKPRDDFYFDAHPVPADVILLIEVSDTTLAKDQQTKALVYAEAQIDNYWIVNLQEKQLEVYSQPVKGRYKLREIYLPGEKIKLVALDIEIKFETFFGKLEQ